MFQLSIWLLAIKYRNLGSHLCPNLYKKCLRTVYFLIYIYVGVLL